MMTRLEREVQGWKERYEKREKELLDQHSSQISQMEKSHKEAIGVEKQKAETELYQTKQVNVSFIYHVKSP